MNNNLNFYELYYCKVGSNSLSCCFVPQSLKHHFLVVDCNSLLVRTLFSSLNGLNILRQLESAVSTILNVYKVIRTVGK